MTIHCKAVEQYFTVVLFVNPLTPRVQPWVIQSFLTFDSLDRTLSMTTHLKAIKQYFTVVLFVFQFPLVCNFRKFDNFGLCTVRNEGFYHVNLPGYSGQMHSIKRNVFNYIFFQVYCHGDLMQ